MDPAVRDLITRIHNGPMSFVLCTTGGGAGLLSWLLAVPGGSRTVLEGMVPYDEHSLAEFLGRVPAAACSGDTAELMAQRALARARWLAPGRAVAGVACTASLRSDRPKRGDHRFHVAIATSQQVLSASLTLAKEARSREGEEEVVDRVFLNLLAQGVGVDGSVPVELLPGEHLEAGEQGTSSLLDRFFRGSEPAVCIEPDGQVRAGGIPPRVLLPGSFNPLHPGHLELAQVAGGLVGAEPAFELTAINADKPVLAEEEVRCRAAQFAWKAQLWLSRLPTFAEKAQQWPGVVFVVGADTASRVVQPRFYGDSFERLQESLTTIRTAGCRFLVAGRVDARGHFTRLEELQLPTGTRDLFAPIAPEHFRADISSTQLRQNASQ